MKTLSFTRTVHRHPDANSDINKRGRLENIQKFIAERNGCTRVYIDETHWKIGALKNYAWGETGTKRLQMFKEVNDTVTAITAITSSGKCFAVVSIGNVDHLIFEGFMKDVLVWL